MLNPDGAQRRQRRNAQGLDVNRDALQQQSPEGRLLKVLRDRLRPAIGFNLHNQSWRTSTGTPPRPAAISLLAVAYDEARSENEGRRLTKRRVRRGQGRGRAARARDGRTLRRRVRGSGVRRQPDEVGHAGRADRDRALSVPRTRPGAGQDQLRRPGVGDRRPRDRSRARRGSPAVRHAAAELRAPVLHARDARQRGGRHRAPAVHRRHRHRRVAGGRRARRPPTGVVVGDESRIWAISASTAHSSVSTAPVSSPRPSTTRRSSRATSWRCRSAAPA